MNNSSPLLADQAPSIGFDNFSPSNVGTLVQPAQTATDTTGVLEHWLFASALPDWMQYLLAFAAGISVLMIVAGGVMLMLTGADEEMQSKGTKTIVWAIIGLIISVLSYTIVEIVNQVPISGTNPIGDVVVNDENGVLANLVQGDLKTQIIPQVIKIILALVGTLAFGLLLYAGGLMVLRDSDEDKISTARKLIIWSLVGIVVVVLSYAIVEAVVQFNFERG